MLLWTAFSALAQVPNQPALTPADTAAFSALRQGPKLSETEARALEKKLEGSPADFETRCQLIGYYTARLGKNPTESARQALVRHSFWIMENHPDSPIAGLVSIDPSNVSRATPAEVERARAIWSKQITT